MEIAINLSCYSVSVQPFYAAGNGKYFFAVIELIFLLTCLMSPYFMGSVARHFIAL